MRTNKSKATGYRVYGIHRGRLPSGTWAYLGFCKIRGVKVPVASMNQDAGSWFSYGN